MSERAPLTIVYDPVGQVWRKAGEPVRPSVDDLADALHGLLDKALQAVRSGNETAGLVFVLEAEAITRELRGRAAEDEAGGNPSP